LRLIEQSGKFVFADLLGIVFEIRKIPAANTSMSTGKRMSVVIMLIVQACLAAMAQGQSANMIGKWNIEIIFADGNKRLLRFDAQGDGKGSFELLDPRAKAWGAATHWEARWSLDKENAVTFSGPVEFMLGNVGRDAGTLIFKGKFETPGVITGEVEFAPLVGERPSKHGTFRAVRQ
jgi:hypothetical protein